MVASVLLFAVAGCLFGCTLAGVQVIPSVGVTSHGGDIEGESLYVGAMFIPPPEVRESQTFRPAQAPASVGPGATYTPARYRGDYSDELSHATGPLGPLAQGQGQPTGQPVAGQHVEHREPVTIETPWGKFAVYGLGGALLATVAAIAAMLKMGKSRSPPDPS